MRGGKGGGKGGQSKSLNSFYGTAKTTEERQAVWDSVYKANVKRSLSGFCHHQMPSDRPGRRRAAPGDHKRNAALNAEHDAQLDELKATATREWKADHGKGGEQGQDKDADTVRKRKAPPGRTAAPRRSPRIAAQ